MVSTRAQRQEAGAAASPQRVLEQPTRKAKGKVAAKAAAKPTAKATAKAKNKSTTKTEQPVVDKREETDQSTSAISQSIPNNSEALSSTPEDTPSTSTPKDQPDVRTFLGFQPEKRKLCFALDGDINTGYKIAGFCHFAPSNSADQGLIHCPADVLSKIPQIIQSCEAALNQTTSPKKTGKMPAQKRKLSDASAKAPTPSAKRPKPVNKLFAKPVLPGPRAPDLTTPRPKKRYTDSGMLIMPGMIEAEEPYTLQASKSTTTTFITEMNTISNTDTQTFDTEMSDTLQAAEAAPHARNLRKATSTTKLHALTSTAKLSPPASNLHTPASTTEMLQSALIAQTTVESDDEPSTPSLPSFPWGIRRLVPRIPRSVSKFVPNISPFSRRIRTPAPEPILAPVEESIAQAANPISTQALEPITAQVIEPITAQVIEPTTTPASDPIPIQIADPFVAPVSGARPEAVSVSASMLETAEERERLINAEVERRLLEREKAARKAKKADGKRKRRASSPDEIPPPPGASYGLNLDFFSHVSTDDEDGDGSSSSGETSRRSSKRSRLNSQSPKASSRGNTGNATPYTGKEFADPNSNVFSSPSVSDPRSSPRFDPFAGIPESQRNYNGHFQTPGYDGTSSDEESSTQGSLSNYGAICASDDDDGDVTSIVTPSKKSTTVPASTRSYDQQAHTSDRRTTVTPLGSPVSISGPSSRAALPRKLVRKSYIPSRRHLVDPTAPKPPPESATPLHDAASGAASGDAYGAGSPMSVCGPTPIKENIPPAATPVQPTPMSICAPTPAVAVAVADKLAKSRAQATPYAPKTPSTLRNVQRLSTAHNSPASPAGPPMNDAVRDLLKRMAEDSEDGFPYTDFVPRVSSAVWKPELAVSPDMQKFVDSLPDSIFVATAFM